MAVPEDLRDVLHQVLQQVLEQEGEAGEHMLHHFNLHVATCQQQSGAGLNDPRNKSAAHPTPASAPDHSPGGGRVTHGRSWSCRSRAKIATRLQGKNINILKSTPSLSVCLPFVHPPPADLSTGSSDSLASRCTFRRSASTTAARWNSSCGREPERAVTSRYTSLKSGALFSSWKGEEDRSAPIPSYHLE